MLPEKTLSWGVSRNCMRELSAYGVRRKQEIGADHVYDFALGNPSVLPPAIVNQSIIDIIREEGNTVHAYTTAAGIPSLRAKIADDLNARFDLGIGPDLLYISTGAAAALTASLHGVIIPGDEVICLAPFFTEYRVFSECAGAQVVVVPPAEDFSLNLDGIRAALTDRTKALIINSPNNPSGAVVSAEELNQLGDLLREQEAKTGSTIYLISDEPYREIVYDGFEYACPLNYYDDSIMCYSFSKALSVSGERIGYFAVNPKMNDAANVYASLVGAARGLGYVNPPALFQRVIERSLGSYSDVSEYKTNRDILCNGLRELGYEFVEPQGAFYLFMKALEPDALAFCERAKKYELLLPASNDFGCEGYVRISYCVARSTIENSMPAFKALMESYR